MRKTSITALSSPPCKPWAKSRASLLASWTGTIALFLALSLLSCSAPPSVPTSDPTVETWYTETVEKLESLTMKAKAHFEAGRSSEAAQLIKEGVPLSKQILEIPRPNLRAMQAASDLDQLYGDMLRTNRHFGYAREFYQRNAARWRHWKPQTDDTLRRLKEANDAIARCDEQMAAER